MTAATELPTWAVYAVSFGTPSAALAGVLIGHFLTRRAAKELEKRSKREEVMRNVRWAAELAVDSDPAKANLGVYQLRTLSQSNLNDPDVQQLVDSALDSVVEDVADEIDEAAADDEPVAILRIAGVVTSTEGGAPPGDPPVPSETEDDPEGDSNG